MTRPIRIAAVVAMAILLFMLWYFSRHKDIYEEINNSKLLGNDDRANSELELVRNMGGVFAEVDLKEEFTQFAKTSDVPIAKVSNFNCSLAFHNDRDAIRNGSRQSHKFPVSDNKIRGAASSNCTDFVRKRRYLRVPVSAEEADFPIAFSLLVFKDAEQVERLLRAIYRPQNYYCIHVDKKSSTKFRQAISAVAACFENVFLASKSIDVRWGWYSVVEPELVCMNDLWKYKKWRYFINLTGQEFPLKTNLDLVKILTVYNGANDIEATEDRRNLERTLYVHNGFYPTEVRKTPLPVNVTLTKGSVHIAASRGFVDFVLHDVIAIKFRDWLMDSGVPDETLFSSLSHSPHLGVPGAYLGKPETHPHRKPFLTRFKNWGVYPFKWPCRGKFVRSVCILGVGDLPLLKTQPHMFANKFYSDYQPLAYDCLEELHYQRIRDEISGARFDVSYYKSLSFVKHHVM